MSLLSTPGYDTGPHFSPHAIAKTKDRKTNPRKNDM